MLGILINVITQILARAKFADLIVYLNLNAHYQ
jgi:hypothetical protein